MMPLATQQEMMDQPRYGGMVARFLSWLRQVDATYHVVRIRSTQYG